jgi:hypothetical protein
MQTATPITQKSQVLELDSDNLQNAVAVCLDYANQGALKSDTVLHYLLGQIQLHSLEVANSADMIIETLN